MISKPYQNVFLEYKPFNMKSQLFFSVQTALSDDEDSPINIKDEQPLACEEEDSGKPATVAGDYFAYASGARKAI